MCLMGTPQILRQVLPSLPPWECHCWYILAPNNAPVPNSSELPTFWPPAIASYSICWLHPRHSNNTLAVLAQKKTSAVKCLIYSDTHVYTVHLLGRFAVGSPQAITGSYTATKTHRNFFSHRSEETSSYNLFCLEEMRRHACVCVLGPQRTRDQISTSPRPQTSNARFVTKGKVENYKKKKKKKIIG